MKKLVTISFMLLPFVLFSQKRFSLDAVFSPDATYRILSFDENNPTAKLLTELLNKRENPSFNFHTGLYVNYFFTEKFAVKAGIEFAKIGTQSDLKSIFGDQVTTSNPGTFNPVQEPTYNSLKLKSGFFYYNFPIALRYKFSNKRCAPYTEIGFVPSIQAKTYSKLDIDNEKPRFSTRSVNDFTGFIHWAFGANYSLTDNWQIFMQPTIRYQIITANTNPIKQNDFSVGLELGARLFL